MTKDEFLKNPALPGKAFVLFSVLNPTTNVLKENKERGLPRIGRKARKEYPFDVRGFKVHDIVGDESEIEEKATYYRDLDKDENGHAKHDVHVIGVGEWVAWHNEMGILENVKDKRYIQDGLTELMADTLNQRQKSKAVFDERVARGKSGKSDDATSDRLAQSTKDNNATEGLTENEKIAYEIGRSKWNIEKERTRLDNLVYKLESENDTATVQKLMSAKYRYEEA